MGLFTPKYPTSDTPGVDATGNRARRETRSDRRDRQTRLDSNRRKAAQDRAVQGAVRASKARSTAFWEDYERRNGPGSVDWS